MAIGGCWRASRLERELSTPPPRRRTARRVAPPSPNFSAPGMRTTPNSWPRPFTTRRRASPMAAFDVWHTKAEFLAGAEPGRQRTWHETRLDDMKVAQTTANGVNLTVKLSRMGRDGKVLSADEGIFLVVLREGAWKVQARSLMGT